MRLGRLQLFVPLACLCAAVCPAQEAEVAVVADAPALNALLARTAGKGGTKLQFRLPPDCPLPVKKLIRQSLWYDYAASYHYSKGEDGVYTVQLVLKDSTRMLLGHRDAAFRKRLNKKELNSLAIMEARLKRLITPGMTDMEKVRAIHDDLIDRVTYDIKSGGECTTLMLTDMGLCEAYSRYIYLALQICGIDCHIVLGKAGCPHAWNLVKLNGHWFHMDATWDDPISSRPMLRHDYFCISDKAIARDHRWNTETYPAAPEMSNSYFKKQHRYFTRYEELWAAVGEAYRGGAADFEAKLTPLAKETAKDGGSFPSALAEFTKKNPEIRVESYTRSATDPAIIYLTFTPKESTRKDVTPTERKPERPKGTDSARGWLDLDTWADLCSDFDSDKWLREGRKLLDEGAEKGKELMQEGAGKLLDAVDSLF